MAYKTEFDLGTIPKGDAKTVSVSIKMWANPFYDIRHSCIVRMHAYWI